MLATHAHRNWWPKIHTFLWAKVSLFQTQMFLVLSTAFSLLFLDIIQGNTLKVINVWYLGPDLEVSHNGLLQDGPSLMLSKDLCQTQESLTFCWHLQSADKLTYSLPSRLKIACPYSSLMTLLFFGEALKNTKSKTSSLYVFKVRKL